jgi:hypothetical protein
MWSVLFHLLHQLNADSGNVLSSLCVPRSVENLLQKILLRKEKKVEERKYVSALSGTGFHMMGEKFNDLISHLPELAGAIREEKDDGNDGGALFCSPFLPSIHRNTNGGTLSNFRHNLVHSLVVRFV